MKKKLPLVITVVVVLGLFITTAVGAWQCGRDQQAAAFFSSFSQGHIEDRTEEAPISYGAVPENYFQGKYRAVYYYQMKALPLPWSTDHYVQALPLTFFYPEQPSIFTVAFLDTIPASFKRYQVCLDCPHRIETLREPVKPKELIAAPEKPSKQ